MLSSCCVLLSGVTWCDAEGTVRHLWLNRTTYDTENGLNNARQAAHKQACRVGTVTDPCGCW